MTLHPSSQEVKSYPVQWIKVAEKLDEGAFHRKHMFQVVVVPTAGMPNAPPQATLHLQAMVGGTMYGLPCTCTCSSLVHVCTYTASQ